MPNQHILDHFDPTRCDNDGASQSLSAPSSRPVSGGADPEMAPPRTRNGREMEVLAQMVEGDIIPRLLLAHKVRYDARRDQSPLEELDQGAVTKSPVASPVAQTVIADLAMVLLTHDVDDVETILHGHMRAGMPLDQIFLDLMAPAARFMGAMWEDDTASFADVTIGLGRLQTLLHRLSEMPYRDDDVRSNAPSGLFVTPSGEAHSFGIHMVDELFRRAGWRTVCEPSSRMHEVLTLVSSQSFHLLGIGLSSEGQVPFARELIRQVRTASCNPHILVMVGGSYVIGHPDTAMGIGADFTATDGRQAIAIAETVLYEHANSH